MILVKGNECRMESTGELFRLMAGHRGGTVIPCTADTPELDLLCTAHDGYLFLSAVNRSAAPKLLRAEGYTLSDCTEIEVREYSFESNDFAVREGKDATVSGHSILFAVLRRE